MYSIFDAHCDTIVKVMDKGENMRKNSLHIDLERLKPFGSPVQVFAIWLNKTYYPIALRQTIKYIDFYYSELENNKDTIGHINTFDDIIDNKRIGKISSILSIEGGEALEGEVASLRILYRLGVRLITLTWNQRNELADGIGEDMTRGGLAAFGREIVKEMNRIGMVIDVSHISEQGFWDVYRISEKPFIASHSNARKICNVKRNLTDEQIKAIAERGGVIGINIYPHFIAHKKTVNTDDIMKHIDHIINLVGDDYLGFGFDYDGIDTMPEGMEEVSKINILIQAIESKYGIKTTKKITEDNFIRVFRDILKTNYS